MRQEQIEMRARGEEIVERQDTFQLELARVSARIGSVERERAAAPLHPSGDPWAAAAANLPATATAITMAVTAKITTMEEDVGHQAVEATTAETAGIPTTTDDVDNTTTQTQTRYPRRSARRRAKRLKRAPFPGSQPNTSRGWTTPLTR